MKIVALDLSLTCTGVVASDDPGQPRVIKPAASIGRGWDRIRWIQQEVQSAVTGADLVILEGYAHGTQRAIQTGELGGIIRFTIWCLGIPFVEIAPTTVKKVATGSGRGEKVGVIIAARDRLGYEGADHNEADAMWLLQAGLHHYRLPGAVRLPQNHTATLHRIAWPELGVAV